MKKTKLIALACVLSTAALAYTLIDNIITRLGMQEQNARWYITRNFIGRFDSGPMEDGMEYGPANSVYMQLQSFQIPRARLLSEIMAGDKAGAARDLCGYVKKYISSEEFAAEYKRLRDDACPLSDRGMSIGDLRRSAEVHKTNIRNYPNDTKYVAEQQKQLEEVQKRITALEEAAKKNFPGKEAWEKTYPSDPAVMIKKRLQEYLQVAATVDFSAKLTGSGKKQLFTNPAYEKKPLKWKAIFRAGKEVNDVVTAFVKEWLKGEIIPAEKTSMKEQALASPQPIPSVNASVASPAATSGTEQVPAPNAAGQATPSSKKKGLGALKDKVKAVINN